MTKLRFKFQEMIDELSSLEELARDFIDLSSREVLLRFRTQLESYRNSKSATPFDWEIRQPLRTIAATEYEPAGGGGPIVVGEITCKWRIKLEQPTKKSALATEFSLIGIASTRVSLKFPENDAESAKEIAMWRMEVADSKSPGCFFHVQVLGQQKEPPFPKSIPVPRLPSIILTPAAVVEFMLAELFQDRWEPHIAGRVPHLNRWVPIQQRRLERLLDWKLSAMKSSSGSPWSRLKKAQPAPDLFVG